MYNEINKYVGKHKSLILLKIILTYMLDVSVIFIYYIYTSVLLV